MKLNKRTVVSAGLIPVYFLLLFLLVINWTAQFCPQQLAVITCMFSSTHLGKTFKLMMLTSTYAIAEFVFWGEFQARIGVHVISS